MKTPITYYGGKQNLVKEIIPRLHSHTRYVEPFCGGAAILFAKKPAEMETLNDTNGELMNFYRVVKQDYAALENLIQGTLHSRMAHHEATHIYKNPGSTSPLKRAWALWVLTHQSFAHRFDGSFGYDISGTTARKTAQKRTSFSHHYAQRLQYVQLECADAIKIINTYDSPNTLYYCDPPYYNSHCGHYGGYTIEDYTTLLKTLSDIEGTFLLSSYPSPLLAEYTMAHGWYAEFFYSKVTISKHKSKKHKTEVITANYPLKKQYDLFDSIL